MKRKKTAFTLVELLTVLAVMSLLIGILIPSLKMAQDAARTAKQKMHLASIDQALFAFRNDYGEYPKSELTISPNGSYCGAQKLAEALLGLDLLGCDKRTNWDGDLALYSDLSPSALTKRMPRYLEIENANVFSVGDRNNIPRSGLYENPAMLLPETYVLCDIFNRNSVEMGGKQVKAGLPILYYRADPSKVGFSQVPQTSIYNFTDNFFLIMAQQMNETSPDRIHPLGPNGPVPGGLYFYNENYKIFDKKVAQATGGKPWPHRPDSYILISAGIDGLYGTNDDIVNFEY